MTKILNSGLALILMALGSVSASAENLYISDSSGKLGYIDLSNNHVTVLGNSGVVLHDIGFTSNGNLYGDTTSELYSISTINGLATPIGSFGNVGKNAMVGLTENPSGGLLAASGTTTKIYAIDTAPYAITTLTGSLSGYTNGDITFGLNGELYDILVGGNLAKVTIVGNTITQTVIGNTGNTKISGMATESNGTVLAIAGTQVYIVDTSTAHLTPFLNYSGHGLGTATGAAILNTLVVPEPSSVALLLAGVAGLLYFQKRRLAGQA